MDVMQSKYVGKDNYGNPKQEYIKKLTKMTDAELSKACDQVIWLSACHNNNPRSDYHWKCDACYDECEKRNNLAIYESAYNCLPQNAR